MINIKVWMYGTFNPLKFENVDDYHETKDALIIQQEELYKSTTTKIFKPALLRYEVEQNR